MHGHILREPHNLASGWVNFDFEKAFGCRVKVINDAAMQALGSYKGGSMLFLARSARAGPIPSRYRISGSFRFQSGRVSVAAQKPAWLLKRTGFEPSRPLMVAIFPGMSGAA